MTHPKERGYTLTSVSDSVSDLLHPGRITLRAWPCRRWYPIRLSLLLALLGLAGCGVAGVSEVRWVGWGRPVLVRAVGGIYRHESDAANPAAVRQGTVYLRGVVGDRIPLIDGQIYELQDSTGRIWVVTTDTARQSGDRVLIRGDIRWVDEVLPDAGEMDQVYVQELELLQHRTALSPAGEPLP